MGSAVSREVTRVYRVERWKVYSIQQAIQSARAGAGIGGRKTTSRHRPGGKYVEITAHLKGNPNALNTAIEVLNDRLPAIMDATTESDLTGLE